MSSEDLHIAIGKAMKQMGDNIIASPQFVNILSDLSAFRDIPACKVILKDMQESGVLSQVYDAYQQKGKSCIAELDTIKKAVNKNGKYKRPHVTYIFDCFLYAFGAINDVKAPEINAYDAFANQGSILDTLNDRLEDLKSEYQDLLYKGIVLPKNRLTDPAGYYTTQTMNELYLISSKYRVIADALQSKDVDYFWCQNKLKEQLDKYAAQKKQACERELTRLKDLYNSVLKKAEPNSDPKKKRPTDIDSQSIAKLSPIETDIRKMYDELGVHYDDWCFDLKKARIEDFVKIYIAGCESRLNELKDAYKQRLDKANANKDPQKEKPTDLDDKSIADLSKIEKDIKSQYREAGIEYDDWCSTERYLRLVDFRNAYFATREERLKELKKEYLDCLNQAQRDSLGALVSPKGIDSESEKKLSRIQTLIKSCYIDLERQYDDWCEVELGKKIKKLQSDFVIQCASELNKLKADYANKLEHEALVTHKGLISRSAEFDEAVLQSLRPLEEDIKTTYRNVNRTYDNFCENTQSEILERHYVSPQKRRNQILTRIVAPLVIAAFPISWGTQYMMYKGDIDKFDDQMIKANGFVDQGNLSSALMAYDQAADDYEHSFLGKKGEAEKAIDELVDRICIEAEDLISQNRFAAASAKINEIPDNIISENSEIKQKVSSTQAKLASAINSVVNSLITNISSNGGKLNADGKKMLDEALLVSPNDYWLNFIKNKEK